MEEIIKTLKENHLFKDVKNINIKGCNKLNEFFDTYKFNPTNKQRLPKNIKRDKKGRIILDEIPFISTNISPNNSSDNEWIILNNGTRLLLKKDRTHVSNLQELLIMYLIKSTNTSCANYDLATLNGEEMLVVPSFLRINDKLLTPFKDSIYAPEINEAYVHSKDFNSEAQILKTIFLDRIYGNVDRFPYNFCAIEGKINNKPTQMKVCPLFDNAEVNGLFFREERYGNFPYVGEDKDSSFDKVMNTLLEYEEVMNWVKHSFKNSSLCDISEKLYKEKGIQVDKRTYKKFETFFSDSEALINDEIKNKGEAFKIKLK